MLMRGRLVARAFSSSSPFFSSSAASSARGRRIFAVSAATAALFGATSLLASSRQGGGGGGALCEATTSVPDPSNSRHSAKSRMKKNAKEGKGGTRKTREVFLIAGPHGAEKDALLAAVAARLKDNRSVAFCRRFTDGPTQADHGMQLDHAVGAETFKKMLDRQEFVLAWADGTTGVKFGISKADVFLNQSVVVLNVSHSTIQTAKGLFPAGNTSIIHVTAPDAVLVQRVSNKAAELAMAVSSSKVAASPGTGNVRRKVLKGSDDVTKAVGGSDLLVHVVSNGAGTGIGAKSAAVDAIVALLAGASTAVKSPPAQPPSVSVEASQKKGSKPSTTLPADAEATKVPHSSGLTTATAQLPISSAIMEGTSFIGRKERAARSAN